ncbi:MAG TPA: T9SS type A sorting domain-containing protein, partial [Ignavibacteriaceae bacterium]
FFENTGTAAFPDFANWFINPFGIFDAGNNSKHAFTFLDSDNDYDLYVGEAGFTIYFMRNTGSVSSPDFNYVSPNPPHGITNLGSNVYPVFVDIDDDGDQDLFTGETEGNIYYYRYTGTQSNPSFAARVINPFGITDVGNRSAPAFCDVDKDEDFDLFVGNEAGNIIFFRNTGTKTDPAFGIAQTNPFGLADIGSLASPSFIDINNDDKEDLFVGTQLGDIYYFRNTTVVSVEEEQQSNFVELKVYPNPVSNYLNISAENSNLDNTEFALYTILGEKIVATVSRNGSAAQINISDLAPGLYILTISNEQINYSTKIIKSGKGF